MDTVIRFIKRFTFDLFHAVLFAAQEYDIKLQSEKTQLERFITWIIIGIIAIAAFLFIIWGVWKFLDSIEIKGI